MRNRSLGAFPETSIDTMTRSDIFNTRINTRIIFHFASQVIDCFIKTQRPAGVNTGSIETTAISGHALFGSASANLLAWK